MNLRSIPRVFIPGADPAGPIDIPEEELNKLRHVLRLKSGSQISVLPDDGTLIRCELQGKQAVPQEVVRPNTEPRFRITLAQALPKGDKLDDIVRACTGIGVSHFVLFASERTIVKWDAKKQHDRMRRLASIAREEAEVGFRTKIPTFQLASNLKEVLLTTPDAVVLSESEGVTKPLVASGSDVTIVVGPEGGWDAREMNLIGERGVTLGPRVLRVEYAGPAAAAILLLGTS